MRQGTSAECKAEGDGGEDEIEIQGWTGAEDGIEVGTKEEMWKVESGMEWGKTKMYGLGMEVWETKWSVVAKGAKGNTISWNTTFLLTNVKFVVRFKTL